MKKMLFVCLCAVVAMAAVSCAKSEIGAPAFGARVPAVVNAVAGNTSKLTIDGLQTSWEMGDAISVFDVTGKSEGTFTTEDSGTNVSFTGTKGEGDVLKYAIFPANPDATCAGGVFSTTIPAEQDGTIASAIAVAEESDGTFEFLNAASVIKITIPEEMTGINFIAFTADTKIAGDVVVKDLTAEPSDAEDAVNYTRVSIYNNGSELTGDQYLTVIPGTYSGYVVLGKKDGNVRYSAAVKVASKEFKVDRIKNFGTPSEVGTNWVKNAVPGIFSISADGVKAFIAQGEIRYNVETEAWRIADTFERLTTYDITAGEIDLFRWNNAATPIATTDYGTKVTAWSPAGDWTTKLPESGWSIRPEADYTHLLKNRTNVAATFGLVYVGTEDSNTKYVVIYPDGWAGHCSEKTKFSDAVTMDELKAMEDKGCAVCGLGNIITKKGTLDTTPTYYFWATNWTKSGVVRSYRFYYDTNKATWINEGRGIESKYAFPVRPFYEIK